MVNTNQGVLTSYELKNESYQDGPDPTATFSQTFRPNSFTPIMAEDETAVYKHIE